MNLWLEGSKTTTISELLFAQNQLTEWLEVVEAKSETCWRLQFHLCRNVLWSRWQYIWLFLVSLSFFSTHVYEAPSENLESALNRIREDPSHINLSTLKKQPRQSYSTCGSGQGPRYFFIDYYLNLFMMHSILWTSGLTFFSSFEVVCLNRVCANRKS